MAASDVIDEVLASDLVDDPTRRPAAEPSRAEATARRRRRWGEQASLAAVTLGALGGFIAVSRTITGKEGNKLDRAVMRSVVRARRPLGNAIVRGITFFGSVPGAVGVSLAALALARKKPRLALQIVVGALGGVSAELGIKRIFRRARPRIAVHLEDVVGSTSFPSGHATAASSLYLTLAFVASRSRALRAHRGKLLAGAAAFATLIGATRVYLGVHWPTDVFGGLALGTAWASTAEAVFDITGAERVEREAGVSPPEE
jgi:undecaprenyl-diphosphatase